MVDPSILFNEVFKMFLYRNTNPILNSRDSRGVITSPYVRRDLVIGKTFTLIVAGGSQALGWRGSGARGGASLIWPRFRGHRGPRGSV